MAKQTVNIGTSENANNGDPLRTAFTKINQNFDELYAGGFADPASLGVSMIPSTDGTIDLGSLTKRYSEVHVKDFIYLGGVRLSTDANNNLVIAGGAVAIQDVQGDIFADDSTKVFDSASSTFTGSFVGDINGSVFADDSTLLVDGVAGKIVGPVEASTITSSSYVDASSVNANTYGAKTVGSFINFGVNASVVNMTASIDMQNYSIGNVGTITASQFNGTNLSVDNGFFISLTGDLTGSIFADDSTLLVDGVNGEIPGYVKISDLKTALQDGAGDYAAFKAWVLANL